MHILKLSRGLNNGCPELLLTRYLPSAHYVYCILRSFGPANSVNRDQTA